MSMFSNRMTAVRESLGMNKTEFAEYLGTSLSNISRYESSEMGVSLDTVEGFARKLNINPGWLLGWDVDKYLEVEDQCKQIPIIGTIAAGLPILAGENIDGYECVIESFNADFCLRVRGDSMKCNQCFVGCCSFVGFLHFTKY